MDRADIDDTTLAIIVIKLHDIPSLSCSVNTINGILSHTIVAYFANHSTNQIDIYV